MQAWTYCPSHLLKGLCEQARVSTKCQIQQFNSGAFPAHSTPATFCICCSELRTHKDLLRAKYHCRIPRNKFPRKSHKKSIVKRNWFNIVSLGAWCLLPSGHSFWKLSVQCIQIICSLGSRPPDRRGWPPRKRQRRTIVCLCCLTAIVRGVLNSCSWFYCAAENINILKNFRTGTASSKLTVLVSRPWARLLEICNSFSPSSEFWPPQSFYCLFIQPPASMPLPKGT